MVRLKADPTYEAVYGNLSDFCAERARATRKIRLDFLQERIVPK